MSKEKIPVWSTAMRKYVIDALAAWTPYKDIWLTVTDPQTAKVTTLVPLDPKIHTYDLFRMRCQRLPKHEIALAHQEWQREIGVARWAEEKARVQGLSDLIDRVNGYITDGTFNEATGTLSSLVGQMRKLFEQVRKEISAKADRAALSASGAHILLTNPKNVQLDANHVAELLLVYRTEIGGLHNLDLSALNIKELEQLRDKCQQEIDDKIGQITETEYEEENEDGDEDNPR